MSTIELRNFLFIHKITQGQFAKMIGVSRQTVSYYCNGRRNIPQRVEEYCKEYEYDTNNKK